MIDGIAKEYEYTQHQLKSILYVANRKHKTKRVKETIKDLTDIIYKLIDDNTELNKELLEYRQVLNSNLPIAVMDNMKPYYCDYEDNRCSQVNVKLITARELFIATRKQLAERVKI